MTRGTRVGSRDKSLLTDLAVLSGPIPICAAICYLGPEQAVTAAVASVALAAVGVVVTGAHRQAHDRWARSAAVAAGGAGSCLVVAAVGWWERPDGWNLVCLLTGSGVALTGYTHCLHMAAGRRRTFPLLLWTLALTLPAAQVLLALGHQRTHLWLWVAQVSIPAAWWLASVAIAVSQRGRDDLLPGTSPAAREP